MKKILLSILMSLTLICNCPMNVYASSIEDIANDIYLSNESMGNLLRFLLEGMGVVLNPSLWGTGSLNERFQEYMTEQALIIDSDSYLEYLKAHLPISEDENGEVIYSADNDIVNNLYNFAVQTIEEESGFRTHLTLDSTQYLKANVDKFITNSQYNAYLNYCKEHSDLVFYGNMSTSDFTLNGVTYAKCFYFYEIDVTETDFTWYYNYMYGFQNDFYDKDWQKIALNRYIVTQDGDVLLYDSSALQGNYLMHGYFYNASYNKNPLYLYYPYESINGVASGYTLSLIDITYSSYNFLHSYKVQNLRLYDSLADLKNYSAGNRPYYVTETFTNYDSTIDNSTTITQTEIDNSITYGDVYNYITNNYENSDGLTEDELRAILEEYLSQINNSGSSDSDSGSSDDSGGSGGGLSGFLDGLGSIGNAILAILGKLMEILGSAIELVTGAITDLITIIPNSIGELLGALFPVFPEEWIKAITLSLVLGVIVGIVRMFK